MLEKTTFWLTECSRWLLANWRPGWRSAWLPGFVANARRIRDRWLSLRADASAQRTAAPGRSATGAAGGAHGGAGGGARYWWGREVGGKVKGGKGNVRG